MKAQQYFFVVLELLKWKNSTQSNNQTVCNDDWDWKCERGNVVSLTDTHVVCGSGSKNGINCSIAQHNILFFMNQKIPALLRVFGSFWIWDHGEMRGRDPSFLLGCYTLKKKRILLFDSDSSLPYNYYYKGYFSFLFALCTQNYTYYEKKEMFPPFYLLYSFITY